MTLPLTGITVVELGSSLAGPFCTRVLADMGAEVIKVEPPESGDPSRAWGKDKLAGVSAAFQTINKEKRSVVADFRNPADIARLKKYIAENADIVLQNLRPGIADRIGLGAEATLATNDRIIYCNIAAYGNEGPYRELPGYDVLLQAFSGIVDATGYEGDAPARVGVPVIDIGTGLWATIGILAALHRRGENGPGCIVDAAMLDTAIAWQNFGVATMAAGGQAPRRSGLKGPMVVPNNAYQCADGLLFITVGTDQQFVKFCDVIENPDLASDPRFARNVDRVKNEELLVEIINAALGQQSCARWSELLNSLDVPNAPIQSLEDAIDHEQTQASGIIQQSPDGDFQLVGLPLKFDGTRPGFRRAAPDLGEATAEIWPEEES